MRQGRVGSEESGPAEDVGTAEARCSRCRGPLGVSQERGACSCSGRLTAAQRSMRARLAAQSRWARVPRREDRREATAAARRAQRDQFERQVRDEFGDRLTAAELAAAVAARQAAHMTRMAYAASRARRRGGRRVAAETGAGAGRPVRPISVHGERKDPG